MSKAPPRRDSGPASHAAIEITASDWMCLTHVQMGDSNRGQVIGHANGRAVPNGGANGVTSSWAASPVQPTFDRPTFGSPQQPIVDGLDAGYPPSRVYVPPGGVTQI